MKRFSIPPEIGWPMLVIALLLGSVGTGVSIVYFAQSDGGVQVVDRSPPPASPTPPPPARPPEPITPGVEAPSRDR